MMREMNQMITNYLINNHHVQQSSDVDCAGMADSTVPDINNKLAMRFVDLTFEYFQNEMDSSRNNIEAAMIRSLQNVLKDYEPALIDMINRLDIGNLDNVYNSLTVIGRELFKDEDINYGRIATFYSFCGYLSKEFIKLNKRDNVKQIRNCMEYFINEEINPFVSRNGGWEKYAECFPDPNENEKFVFKTGLFVGAVSLMTLAVNHMMPLIR